MDDVDALKPKVEQVIAMQKPSRGQEPQAAGMPPPPPERFLFADDGAVPNNQVLPFLVYKQAVKLDGAADPAAVFEQRFAANGWGRSWRNGIFPYVHYHSSIHEVLAIARGSARVRFGGAQGAELDLQAGDVAVLPAGTGHQRLSGSDDLLVVGAYPPEGAYDLFRGSAEEHARAQLSIAKVPVPATDPLHGRDGPLTRLWKR
jgi:uncharacterized protein YjlB